MKTSLRLLLVGCFFAVASHGATLTVISIADNGPGSLRQAIADAQNGDSIVFDPILTTKKIALTSGQLVITKNITITGLGAANFTVSGNNLSRAFLVTSNATATIASLTITGGSATNGGGIANFATLTLKNVSLLTNSAALGGAVFNSNGVLTVTNSLVSANDADSGGGIANMGTLTLKSSTLTSNTATFGGGLYSTNGTVTVTGSTVAANFANAGGGIYNDVGNTMTIGTGAVVTGNGAFGGGGVYNEGTLTLTGGSVSTNTALDGAGLYNSHVATVTNATLAGNSASSIGGGLYNSGTLTVGSSTLAGNSALQGGGLFTTNGLASVAGSAVTSNTANFGGGLYVGGECDVQTSTLTGNSANFGGGLFNGSACTVQRCTVLSNAAVSTSGGGVYNSAPGKLTVVVSTFVGNTTAGLGGAVGNAGTLTLAESTLAGNDSGLANTGTATVDNTIFSQNVSGGNLSGSVVSRGHNLSDDNTGAASLVADGDQNNTDAGLDPAGLQANGGPTRTIALASDSVAIAMGGPVYSPFAPVAGGGDPVYPPFVDQRGYPRFACGKMDIGAYQTQTTTPPTITLIGAALVTNECPAIYANPGATAASTCGDALAIAGGGAQSLALKNSGVVVAWGSNSAGQTNVPASLTDPTAIAAGDSHSLGLRSDGLVLAWGNNANGQCNVPAWADDSIGIAGGGYHSLALDRSGLVFAWGNNSFGQTSVPGSVTNAVAVAAGRYHSLALRGNGTVVGWGAGTFTAVPEDGVNYGQANVPVGLSNVVAISAGAYHSLGLLGDGTVVAWGGGATNLSPFVDFGQAVVPAGLSNVVAIAAGGFHSLALTGDGTVVAWGNDDYGQTNVPATLGSATAIAAGTYHSLAISIDGAVAGWGLNSNGQTVATSELLAFNLTSQIAVTTNGTPNVLGTATFVYSVGDARGASNSVTRTLVTADTIAPVPNVAPLPALTNTCAVTVTPPKATDACAGQVTATTSDPLTYTARGEYTVHWTYTDGAGNVALQTQDVVIDRPSPPAIACPASISVSNTPGQCGAVVAFNLPVVTPNCASAVVVQIAGLQSGSLFPVGVTTNTFQVTDLETNTAQCSFTVTVNDTEKPQLTCPGNVTVGTAPDSCVSLPVIYPITATDNCPGVTTVCVPTNGSVFAVGTNSVTCTATDAAGNTNSCTFQVIVRHFPCLANIVTNATTSGGTVVNYSVPADGGECSLADVLFSPPSGTLFGPGVHTVNVIDLADASSICQFTVTVRTARGRLNDVYNQTFDLQAAASGTKDAKSVDKLQASLRSALDGSLWGDDLHAFSPQGKTVFKDAGKAVKSMLSLIKKNSGVLDPVTLQNLADETADACRTLAVVKIADATQNGGNAKDLASANNSLAQGDAASSQPDRAIKSYAKAWQTADKAQP